MQQIEFSMLWKKNVTIRLQYDEQPECVIVHEALESSCLNGMVLSVRHDTQN